MQATPASPAISLQPPTGAAVATFVLDNLVWFVLALVLAGFSLAIPNFFQVGILLNILEQSTFVGIMAVDLSIESTMALSAMITAVLFGTSGAGLRYSLDPSWLNLPASVLIAVAVGA